MTFVIIICVLIAIILSIGLLTVLLFKDMDKNDFPTKNKNDVYWQKRGTMTGYSSIGIEGKSSDHK